MQTFESVSSFREKKGRPLVIADPYAGVGPSMALLYTEADIVSKAYVNDMNPEATPLLKANMEQFHAKRKSNGMYIIDCKDARKLVEENPEIIGCADVLLVNLPHDGISHLPNLVAILSDGLDFDALDNNPVDIIVFLILPEVSKPENLLILAQVSRLLRDPEITDKLRGCKSEESAFAIISQHLKNKAA